MAGEHEKAESRAVSGDQQAGGGAQTFTSPMACALRETLSSSLEYIVTEG